MSEPTEFFIDDSITIRMIKRGGFISLSDLELFCRKARRANAKSDQGVTFKHDGVYKEIQVKIKREGDDDGTA